MSRKAVVFFSVSIAALIVISTIISILSPEFYAAESPNWTLQSLGQDYIDLLFVAPLLVFSGIASRNNKGALLVWGGVLFYLIYSYSIYCFALHFNKLFVMYCIILGLSFYGFVYFLYRLSEENVKSWFDERVPVKALAAYLIFVAVAFYALWLMQIIPPISEGKVPKELSDAGLIVNPVHVIDLSVCLPALFITGVLLLKKHNMGFILAPVMLSFCIIMDVTIGVLAWMMKLNGLSSDMSVVWIMVVLAVVSAAMLIRMVRWIKP